MASMIALRLQPPGSGSPRSPASPGRVGRLVRLGRLLRRARRPLVILLGLAALLAGWALWEALTWPDVAALSHRRPTTTAFIERYRDGGWFGKPRPIEWRWVSYDQISPHLRRAVLCAEDMGFFSHHGFERAEMK